MRVRRVRYGSMSTRVHPEHGISKIYPKSPGTGTKLWLVVTAMTALAFWGSELLFLPPSSGFSFEYDAYWNGGVSG